ncbi:FmdE family protein [Desulfovibrio sp. TomC]|uniref:FmdE family protein n=1 Tax=Desulfovibrio sp. TomC TaxID=1562888 RepID=UPI0005752968|nr:FmdE family protein [Desulfovibrio sp. TomC]KHK03671.1 Molybdopterin biosynthesis protein MoeA [Desulfovibrio sp. TomC]
MSKMTELKAHDSSIGPHTFEEFLGVAAAFHGNPAPGLIIGGFMVDAARSMLPEGTLFDAVVETKKCLPDAVQILTPPSYGNGWMRVINLGRYALSLYDKFTGQGYRAWLDPVHLGNWPEIQAWFLKTKPKKEQDRAVLFAEIKAAARSICLLAPVTIRPAFMIKPNMGAIAVCPACGEGYPKADGAICRGCAGEAPYVIESDSPRLRAVPVGEAAGRRVLHDMTRIVPGESKGVEFEAGADIHAGDVCRLQTMGKNSLYVEDLSEPLGDFVHENEAALAFAQAMAGVGLVTSGPPREGKVELVAEAGGLLTVARDRLVAFNCIEGVMCASRQSHLVVEAGKAVAGCRAIPLYLPRRVFDVAMRVLADGPLFTIRPIRQTRAGVLVTGTEIYSGIIEDKFEPVVRAKIEALAGEVVAVRKVPDDRAAVAAAVAELLAAGADLIVTTAGLSVDPDDVTRQGLDDAGLTDAVHGMPVLPGAMAIVGHIGGADVIGVPACALFHRTTSFDLLLPRVLAGLTLTRHDLAELAEGSMCLSCRSCTYPKCPFGK